MTSSPLLPQRLLAGDPGWQVEANVVIVGSGLAGLATALRLRPIGRVLLITKDVISSGLTHWVGSGVPGPLAPSESTEDHVKHTIEVGAGLASESAVRLLVSEGPAVWQELTALGMTSVDATGEQVERALIAEVNRSPEIRVIERAMALDLMLAEGGQVAGITLHVIGDGHDDGAGAVLTSAVVLASGGMGNVFDSTTNSATATADGLAMAWRAGAVLRDLEFVQFHPTALWLRHEADGRPAVISEQLREEGAYLVDDEGIRFMLGQHELADLAPREIVAKAITRRMREQNRPHMWLDARHLGQALMESRFPGVLELCKRYDIDPVRDLIPVAPAAHYASGGIGTDLDGRTSVPGLYACGETASSGVNGADRLADNSVLDGLVFGRRIAADLLRGLPQRRHPASESRLAGTVTAEVMPELQKVMTEHAGVLRNASSLRTANDRLVAMAHRMTNDPTVEAWQTTNALTVSAALIAAAAWRDESRGSHWREDFPARDDVRWWGHVDLTAVNDWAGFTIRTNLKQIATDLGFPDDDYVQYVVAASLDEDLGGGIDVTTSATIHGDVIAWADFIARSEGVVAGLDVVEAVMHHLIGDDVIIERRRADGDVVAYGDILISVCGPARALLTGERTALNLLSHLSGVATVTRRWVNTVTGTKAKIRDTRKTTPLLRPLEKYAVRCGGGVNHRSSLFDEAVVTHNHLVAAGSVTAAFDSVRHLYPDVPVEVDVTNIEQLVEAIAGGANAVLLYRMPIEQIRGAVQVAAGRVTLGAGGGLTLENARVVAETGVDFLAVGTITQSAPALPMAMELRGAAES